MLLHKSGYLFGVIRCAVVSSSDGSLIIGSMKTSGCPISC